MKRFIPIILLAFLCGQAAADITMLLDPTGNPLSQGAYRILLIPSDATQPTVSQVIVVGGGISPLPPVVPPIPQPDTLDAKLTLLLAAVDDPDQIGTTTKPGTRSKLKIAYDKMLELTAWSITDANSLRNVMAGVEEGVLDSLKKTAGWKPWTDGLAELVKPLDFAGVKTTYQAASAKLGGSPVPPPLPPPTTKVTAVTYIYEKDQSAVPAGVAVALAKLNSDGSGIVATDFEQDATTGDGMVPAQYKAALAAAKAAGLPCLVVTAGDQVLRVVKNPRTEAEVLEAVK